VTVQVFGPDGEDVLEASRDLPVERHGTAAADFAADLRDRGAAELIERATEAAE
jgi:hydroxymethylbilane synthase